MKINKYLENPFQREILQLFGNVILILLANESKDNSITSLYDTTMASFP